MRAGRAGRARRGATRWPRRTSDGSGGTGEGERARMGARERARTGGRSARGKGREGRAKGGKGVRERRASRAVSAPSQDPQRRPAPRRRTQGTLADTWGDGRRASVSCAATDGRALEPGRLAGVPCELETSRAGLAPVADDELPRRGRDGEAGRTSAADDDELVLLKEGCLGWSRRGDGGTGQGEREQGRAEGRRRRGASKGRGIEGGKGQQRRQLDCSTGWRDVRAKRTLVDAMLGGEEGGRSEGKGD